jgi:hypothetical protein
VEAFRHRDSFFSLTSYRVRQKFGIREIAQINGMRNFA